MPYCYLDPYTQHTPPIKSPRSPQISHHAAQCHLIILDFSHLHVCVLPGLSVVRLGTPDVHRPSFPI